MHRRNKRNHSLDDGERRACLDGQLPKLPSRDLFGSNQLVQRKQSADREMREEEELQYKSSSVEQMVEKEEPLKAEEEDPVCKDSRRREKKQFGGESRRNQSPDGELRNMKGRSRMADDGEILLRVEQEDKGGQMTRVFGKEPNGEKEMRKVFGSGGIGSGWTGYQKCPLKIFILCLYIDKVYTYLYIS